MKKQPKKRNTNRERRTDKGMEERFRKNDRRDNTPLSKFQKRGKKWKKVGIAATIQGSGILKKTVERGGIVR